MERPGSRVATGRITDSTTYGIRSGDVAPEVKNGRTYVPIRLIAETFGCSVNWDSVTRTATIGGFYPEKIMSFAGCHASFCGDINKHWKQDLIPREIYFRENKGLLSIYVCSRAINAKRPASSVPLGITAKGQTYMTTEFSVWADRDFPPSQGGGSNPVVIPISKGETIEVKATIDPNQDFFDLDRSNNTITCTYTSKG